MLYGRLPTTRIAHRAREVELERVGFVQRQLRRGERRSEACGEVAIDFDGRNMSCARDQSRRKRREPRADFDDVVAGSWMTASRMRVT